MDDATLHGGTPDGYAPLPQPDEVTKREREDGMGAYLMMFASAALGAPLPIVNILAAVIYYFVNRNKGRFVRFHSYQSMMSQLVTGVLNSALVIWGIIKLVNQHDDWRVFIGYAVMTGVVNLAYIVLSIIAAVRARRGQFFYFLLFGSWAYHAAYRLRPEHETAAVNRPPS